MAVKIFFCYAHEDETLLKKLKTYLSPLQRQGLIAVWHDRDISAGTEWEREISQHLNEAKIILLLVSPDFISSDYCYSVEMKRALERHDRNEAIVMPVILRPIYWQGILGKLQALPTDAKPVVDRYWHTLDEALYDVAEGIRTVVEKLSPIRPEAISLLYTLTGHIHDIASVAFSPDGQTVASGSYDKRIKLWNLISGKEVQTLNAQPAVIESIAFSPDGQTVASGNSSHTIKVWNLATGQELRTLTGHTSPIESVAFSPDGQTLASGSMDNTVKLWNLASGKEVLTLTEHRGSVRSVAFHPDGEILASGSEDTTIKLWNLASGHALRTLTSRTSPVYSVAFSPDGRMLASGGEDQTIKIWGEK